MWLDWRPGRDSTSQHHCLQGGSQTSASAQILGACWNKDWCFPLWGSQQESWDGAWWFSFWNRGHTEKHCSVLFHAFVLFLLSHLQFTTSGSCDNEYCVLVSVLGGNVSNDSSFVPFWLWLTGRFLSSGLENALLFPKKAAYQEEMLSIIKCFPGSIMIIMFPSSVDAHYQIVKLLWSPGLNFACFIWCLIL